MKRRPAGVCMFLCVAAISLSAQTPAKSAIASDEDYSKTMKEVAATNTALRKSLTTAPDDVAAAAVKLEALFKDVQTYWEGKKVDDATAAAKTAVAASQAISQAVSSHDSAAVTAAAQQLAGTCMTCHSAHRERLTYDFYRIK